MTVRVLPPQPDNPQDSRKAHRRAGIDRAVKLLIRALDAEARGDRAGLAAAQFEFLCVVNHICSRPGLEIMPIFGRQLAARQPGLSAEAYGSIADIIMRRLFPDRRVRELTEPRGRA